VSRNMVQDGSGAHVRDFSACVAMSFLAGLSTTVGAGIVAVLPANKVPPTLMAFVLAFAGGVMLSTSIVEFWVPALWHVGNGLEDIARISVFTAVGASAFLIFSHLVPEPTNVTTYADIESHREEAGPCVATVCGRELHNSAAPVQVFRDKSKFFHRRWRLAFVMMLALTAHNFPEGMAVAISALDNQRLGWVVMLAIAMHNIPEGIAISVPVFDATGCKWKALWMSFLSGMAEPLGAVVSLCMVRLAGGSPSHVSMENLLCCIGGIMAAVSLKELLPEAWSLDERAHCGCGFACGLALMLITSFLGA